MENLFQETTYKLSRTRNFLLMALFALATLAIFDIGSVSASFVFGAVLILLSLKDFNFYFKPRGLTRLLLLFIVVALIGLVFSEVQATNTTLVRALQLIYWFFLATFVYNTYEYIDKILLSKVVFFSALLFIILDVTFIDMSRNSVAFTVIIMGPLGYYFLKKYLFKLTYAILLVLLILFNGSRTGAILAFLQTVLFFFLFTPVLQKYIKLLLFSLIFFAISLNLNPLRTSLGKFVYPINQRVGELLINPDYVFRNDMSWLQRKAQVNKGLQIFKLHPLTGIGIFNFPQYEMDIDISNIETTRTLRNIENRSAHNTYIALLAETGLPGLSLVIIIFFSALMPFIKQLNKLGSSFESCVFISFIGLLAYFYNISAFYGSSSWLIYGLITGSANFIKFKNYH